MSDSLNSNDARNYIPLGRTFHELSSYAREADNIDLNDAFRVGAPLTWDDLFKEYRVVVLSEAGAGKTQEILNAAKSLRSEGKAAFFLRLEDVPDNLEDAFGEAGTFAEFEAWLNGSEEGWLLLDSVDEARLRHPRDFEKAIRRIGKSIEAVKERAHVLITGRTSAWRPKTDLDYCVAQLPYTPVAVAEQEVASDETSAEEADDLEDWEEASQTEVRTNSLPPSSIFKIVTLDDLDRRQVRDFVSARGVTDVDNFIDAVERADAWSFTTRPQDLSELSDYWIREHRVGSRLQVLQNSVERRLIERDQGRAEAKPLSADLVRQAARLLAGAATLIKDQTIRVPDGAENSKGIPVQELLADWGEDKQASLLSRPIFDEAIYGTVRFHHRSVREYLAAEWFAELLKRDSSRRAVEDLFFKTQYGVEILTPTLRPVLPWLAILDEKIRLRALKVAPEVLLEGGDPSQLPLDVRCAILKEVGAQIVRGGDDRSFRQHDAVQRFANADLVPTIKALLVEHGENDDIAAFLFRMVWLGQLQALRSEVLAASLAPTSEHYRRTTAIRAVRALGHSDDLAQVRTQFAAEAEALDREWLAEVIDVSELTPETLGWFIECLSKAKPKERFTTDRLADKIEQAISVCDLAVLPRLIEELNHLLDEPPLLESRFCEVSIRYGWLLGSAAKAVERLVQACSPAALHNTAIAILHKLSTARHYPSDEFGEERTEIAPLVPVWPELNRAVFWYAVHQARAAEATKGGFVREHWHASLYGSFYQFGASDYEYAISQIQERSSEEDKLVALSLAFELYRLGGRTRSRRDALKRAAAGNAVLESRLATYLRPPARPEARKWRRQELRWKKVQAKRDAKIDKNLADSKAHLSEKLEVLKQKALEKPEFYDAQYYLHERTRDRKKNSNRWTNYNWRSLIPTFGEGVARYYRDGAVAFWRHYRPQLRSEGAASNSTPNRVIFGLVGLEIEAHETPEWMSNLNLEEVNLACRYASFELNGFPTWFSSLFAAHRNAVKEFLTEEIGYELQAAEAENDLHYILDDVSWAGQWAWDDLAPALYEKLKMHEPSHPRKVAQLLKIIQGASSMADAAISALASEKAANTVDLPRLGLWLAVWAGVDPDNAISNLRLRLSALETQDERTTLALHFVSSLFPDRLGDKGSARTAFLTPHYLKTLYLLLIEHIRHEEDIERVGRGTYSPELRDNAQDARNRLYDLLIKTTGKDSFVALSEIAVAMPDRPWLARYPKQKAQDEADLPAWTSEQVRQFNESLERTPRNHRELADLAAMRVLDLKDDFEHGDSSNAGLLRQAAEVDVRKYLGNALREKAQGRYNIPQEEELADAKRPDLRFHGSGFDGPVPVELKIADAGWSGNDLFERLENQLCGDYLRDSRSSFGLFVLAYRGQQQTWKLPNGESVDFEGLVEALQAHWEALSPRFPNVDGVVVLGIDLTKRGA